MFEITSGQQTKSMHNKLEINVVCCVGSVEIQIKI